MPKKQKTPLYARPSTNPHPSLVLSKSATSHSHGSPDLEASCSVGHSLKKLRNEEARQLPLRPPPVATVHPSLRNLLDVPDTPQPRLRPGTRTGIPPQIRHIPGPAPPPSWELLRSRHAPSMADIGITDVAKSSLGSLVPAQISLPGAARPFEGTLLHATLRTMAEHWDWHLYHDNFCLAAIPLRLREILLTYIVRYATDESLARSSRTLRVLFPDENDLEVEAGGHHEFMGDAHEVTRLDLGRALGTWLPKLSFLKKELGMSHARPNLTISGQEVKQEHNEKVLSELPDSWDSADASPNESGMRSSISAFPQGSFPLRFSRLLHLSLALSPSAAPPASVASWLSLLSITPHLSNLQSLSLGYWPDPTLTPFAAAVSATISNLTMRTASRMSYGGTNMYTESESTWREAAGILRKLSRHLYCLKWLDLTGCGAWFGALSWTDKETMNDDLYSGAMPPTGPDWNGSWRNVEYIGLGVGWSPRSLNEEVESSSFTRCSISAEDSTPPPRRWFSSQLASATTKIGRLEASMDGKGLIKQDWDVEDERRKYFARKEKEKIHVIQERAHEVSRYVRALREKASGKWIEFNLQSDV